MTGRVRFGFTQPVTILSFFIASFLLVGIVAAVPRTLQGPGQTLAQAFYYATMAAGIYFILGCLMTATTYGVRFGRYSREYKLTMAQRSLMFQTTTFMGYVLCSAAVYSRIEGWFFLDAVYWATVTLFTIGYGDFAPKTHLGRSLFFPMAIGGILFIGLIVASVSALVVEAGSKKLSVRNIEKARVSVMKNMGKSGGIRVSWFHKKENIRTDKTNASELEQRRHEFDLMRLVQKKAGFDNALTAICFSLGLFCFLWFIGAIVFWRAERGVGDWSYFESLYFTYVTFLTIGYGDFEPASNSSKPAFVMWALLALPTLTVLIGSVGSQISEGVNKITLVLAEKLPASTPALRSLKESARKKKEDIDGDYSAAKPPGFMEDGHAGDDSSSEDTSKQSAAVRGMGGNVQGDGSGPTASEASAAAAKRPLLLLKQIKAVTSHLDAEPPRKYTYEEWTYMLMLLGEDESDASKHRSAGDVKNAENDDGRANKEAEEGDALETGEKWSWLGKRSPLMSGLDEPKWVLGKLIAKLEKELEEVGDEREGKRDGRE